MSNWLTTPTGSRSQVGPTKSTEEAVVPAEPMKPDLPALRWVRIQENPQHPLIALLDGRTAAQAAADALGAPWVPISYACGYILTDGWAFRDANGPISTFCPVPPDSLPVIQALVTELQRSSISGREMALRIGHDLKQLSAFSEMPKTKFNTACTCTLMRICHPAPVCSVGDWLNMPAWALRLPSRRMRLT